MLHFSLMKKRFFVLFACCACVNGLAAAESIDILDTVRAFFDDGSVARVYQVQKGTEIREGVALTYHTNGKVAIEANYKNGKLDGVFRAYYENGNLWQTIGYKDGVEDGISTNYYDNGKKQSSEVYKNGVLNGLSQEWDERGVIRRKMPYENGQIHGLAQIYDELGALKEEMKFEHGLRNGPYRRYKKGVKVMEAEFKNNRCVKNCDF